MPHNNNINMKKIIYNENTIEYYGFITSSNDKNQKKIKQAIAHHLEK